MEQKLECIINKVKQFCLVCSFNTKETCVKCKDIQCPLFDISKEGAEYGLDGNID